MKSDRLLTFEKSESLTRELSQLVPGGVNSPFRSFKDVGGHTLFIERASGSRMIDADGNSFIDYQCAWGPSILGHSHPKVVETVQNAVAAGAVFGAPNVMELEMAKQLVSLMPSIEMVRFVNSGTEAVMSALRLARGFTGRDKIIMFEGCYHGHHDSTLASIGHRSSAGVPEAVAKNTLLAQFNDLNSVRDLIASHGKEIAAIVIEPVAGSMGVIPPLPGFLEGLRHVASKSGAVLIFDEVLTGLRVAHGGAQSLYGVIPDLTCLGKALGGGMPIGAFGGKREIMQRLEPIGDVYQAGTFSGNPATMAGGIAALQMLSEPNVYPQLLQAASRLYDKLHELFDGKRVPIQVQSAGAMFSLVFSETEVTNYQQSLQIDSHRFSQFFQYLIQRGIYLPPSAVDAAGLSLAHSDSDIDDTVKIIAAAVDAVF